MGCMVIDSMIYNLLEKLERDHQAVQSSRCGGSNMPLVIWSPSLCPPLPFSFFFSFFPMYHSTIESRGMAN